MASGAIGTYVNSMGPKVARKLIDIKRVKYVL